ncbi:MAG: DUF5801 repeats-in-toxin domain-containing protein, partial [Ilumatobacteraceae bacterium]
MTAPGPGATRTIVYALGLDGAYTEGSPSGLTSGGVPIRLYEIGGVITGSTSLTEGGVNAGNTTFTIEIGSSSGVLTLTQSQPIDHSQTDIYDGAYIEDLALLANGQVELLVSVTDDYGSGIIRSATASIDLGGNVQFGDDGPADGSVATPDIDATLLSVNTGDGGLTDGNDKELPASITSAALATTFINAVTADYGEDDGSSAAVTIDTAGDGFTFTLTGGNETTGIDTGLTLSDTDGSRVYAYISADGSTIEGRTAADGIGNGDSVFILTIDQATGAITQTQNEAFAHTLDLTDGTGSTGVPPLNGGTVTEGTYSTTPEDFVNLGALDITVTADVRTTDSDGDYVIQTVATDDIADGFKFFDDGPADGSVATPDIDATL